MRRANNDAVNVQEPEAGVKKRHTSHPRAHLPLQMSRTSAAGAFRSSGDITTTPIL
jgi:hypothetical protein